MRRRSLLLLLGLAALLGWAWGASSVAAMPLIAGSDSLTSASVAARSAPLLRIIFVDVGQGDSIILRQGSFTCLIDGGPAGSQSSIETQLTKSGAKRIDTLVITHSHADHIGGLPDVIARFRPHKVVYASEGTTATWRRVKGHLSSIGAVFQKVRTGAVVAIGKLKAKVLSPTTISGQPNDDSVVLLLSAGGKRFLLTGDLHGPNEARVGSICARGPPLYLLKVAHHGSAYSTSASFLAQTHPKFAVISVGHNSYGHPSPNTIARLKAAGAHVYSTQRNGSISLSLSASGAATWSFSRSSTPLRSARVR